MRLVLEAASASLRKWSLVLEPPESQRCANPCCSASCARSAISLAERRPFRTTPSFNLLSQSRSLCLSKASSFSPGSGPGFRLLRQESVFPSTIRSPYHCHLLSVPTTQKHAAHFP